MEAKNLRWVFYAYRDHVNIVLADANNKSLGFPFLCHLSKEELKLLDDLGIRCTMDPLNHYYFDVAPKEYHERVMITAPVYIEVRKGNDVEFYEAGTYTGEWTDPVDYQFVNNAVDLNIPKCKVHIAGHYAHVSE